ncbi:MAG: phosphate ABC transporter permease PstA [Planctomycetales bacterium]|nr:phosphate ABC transporter permease PstA [Planctomycetales bacterium]
MSRELANPNRDRKRKLLDSGFAIVCLLVASTAIVVLLALVLGILVKGGGWLSWDFLFQGHQEDLPRQSGIGQAIVGSLVTCLICGLCALPIGVGAAILLEEFQPRSRYLKWFHAVVQLNITNLAGVPSIVYGILGVTAFVYMFGLFGRIQTDNPSAYEFGTRYLYQVKTLGGDYVTFPCSDKTQALFPIEAPLQVQNEQGELFELQVLEKGTRPSDLALQKRAVFQGKAASITQRNRFYYLHLPFHKSVLAAGLTLALVILPIIIIASQEALRAVPDSLRESAFGLGATRWQVVRGTVLPAATPGIMTGAILAMSRAIGEAAPLLAVMGGVLSTTAGLTNLMDATPTMPVTIYRWAQDDNPDFEHLAAAAIIVLLLFLLLMNSLAIFIRYRSEQHKG